MYPMNLLQGIGATKIPASDLYGIAHFILNFG